MNIDFIVPILIFIVGIILTFGGGSFFPVSFYGIGFILISGYIWVLTIDLLEAEKYGRKKE